LPATNKLFLYRKYTQSILKLDGDKSKTKDISFGYSSSTKTATILVGLTAHTEDGYRAPDHLSGVNREQERCLYQSLARSFIYPSSNSITSPETWAARFAR
jgi:hypothetical protein